jgi:hypothetical protein
MRIPRNISVNQKDRVVADTDGERSKAIQCQRYQSRFVHDSVVVSWPCSVRHKKWRMRSYGADNRFAFSNPVVGKGAVISLNR